jgi:hypothetical protein
MTCLNLSTLRRLPNVRSVRTVVYRVLVVLDGLVVLRRVLMAPYVELRAVDVVLVALYGVLVVLNWMLATDMLSLRLNVLSSPWHRPC